MWSFGQALAQYLNRPGRYRPSGVVQSEEVLCKTLRPGDVLLVEGSSRISTAIKYLTQSTWSHAALYVGSVGTANPAGSAAPVLIEADLVHGVTAVPLAKYAAMPTRICRPVGLTEDDLRSVIEYARARLGHRYDLRNVIDLARYLIAVPPVPTQWRRRMVALGSGDPTRAICSTLIAQAFQFVRYPILPDVSRVPSGACDTCTAEILHIRHHSLFTPRDFDLSPYFEVVKPSLQSGFEYRAIIWADADTAASAPQVPA